MKALCIFRLAENDPVLQNTYQNAAYQRFYHKTKEVCIETVEKYWNIRIPDRQRSPNIITVINDENVAIYCGPGVGILITPPAMLTSALSHEMVHTLNIGHSYSDRKVKVYPQAAIGEYDDKYDLMSTANAHMYSTDYGQTGPSLIGPHLDYLGWLPAHRIFYFGKHSPPEMREVRVKLSSLSLPHKKTWNYLLVAIPYDREDPQLVYTVEYRTKNGVDSGIPYDGVVLIHQIVNRDGYFYSQLITESSFKNEYNQGEQFYRVYEHLQGAFLHITVNRANKDEAEIQIHCTFEPTQCKDTEVRRAAFTDDNVCVSSAEFNEVANDLTVELTNKHHK